MEKHCLLKMPKFFRLWVVLLILLLGPSYGCQTKEPPLSPAAASFKQEIKDCIAKLAKPLQDPVFKRDAAAIQETLKITEPEAIKLCRQCPFRMGVLDEHGNTLAVYPPQNNVRLDFYKYEVVQQALKNRKIRHQRLFMQDGSRLYVICVPLVREEQVVGILAIALRDAEAQKRWGLTEKEFLVLDFNR